MGNHFADGPCWSFVSLYCRVHSVPMYKTRGPIDRICGTFTAHGTRTHVHATFVMIPSATLEKIVSQYKVSGGSQVGEIPQGLDLIDATLL